MILGKPCVVIDLETTGTSASREAITEVGLRFCAPDGSTRDWQQLLNPGRSIPPYISQLTGIRDDMVADAPYFEDIAAGLHAMLDGYMMIAHNARFDYSFLKHAFDSCEFDFRPALICTVKLSRSLYPGEKRHSLDVICERIHYRRERAHRALDDVSATCAFINYAIGEFGIDKVNSAARGQLQRPAQPAHLPLQEVSRIPNTPGVYRFYGEQSSLLYIGKSVRMRERVMSHFNADIRADREMRLAQEVRSIDWCTTAGELGALLRENREIKSQSPIYNRRQRRHKQLWCIETEQQGTQALRVQLTARPLQATNAAMPGNAKAKTQLHGLFSSKSHANKWLNSKIEEYRLCKKMLGLERGSGSCFNFQLKRCDGACAGVEPVAVHNQRVLDALANDQLQCWPFAGAAVIIESAEDWRDAECAQQDIHVIDHWVYLGTVHDPADINSQLSSVENACFDRETYRLLSKFIHLAVPVAEIVAGRAHAVESPDGISSPA
ncbi:MAG: hypothetical protein KJP25_07855 [Gammaproteobacteria bacterium]|nr:hypothetical protein [Gammaproteobacteria bacterium]